MPAHNRLPFALLLLAFLSPLSASAAEGGHISSQVMQSTRVTKVSTAVNHISVIQFPEPVISATIGSESVRMEWHDNRVLLQPLKDGIDTNLTVWTANTRSTYEILPAGEPSEMSYVIDEVFPAPPPPPPGPSPDEVQRATDHTFSVALLKARPINNKKIRNSKKAVTVRIHEITEDNDCFYVHMSAFNKTKFPYRLSEPVANVIRPVFSERLPAAYLNQQIKYDTLYKFGIYGWDPLETHGSTLATTDLQPGDSTEWVVAFNKTGRQPGIYLFTFQGQTPVYAIAVF